MGRSRDAVGEVDPGAGDERRDDENVNVHDQSSSEDEGGDRSAPQTIKQASRRKQNGEALDYGTSEQEAAKEAMVRDLEGREYRFELKRADGTNGTRTVVCAPKSRTAYGDGHLYRSEHAFRDMVDGHVAYTLRNTLEGLLQKKLTRLECLTYNGVPILLEADSVFSVLDNYAPASVTAYFSQKKTAGVCCKIIFFAKI